MRSFSILCVFSIFILQPDAWAGPAEVDQLREQLKVLMEKVDDLSREVKEQKETIIRLQGGSSPAADTPAVAAPLQPVSAAPQAKPSLPFLPEIGVIGDIVGTLSESSEDEEGNDRFSVREIELVFGHDIDPYARFDSTITFSDFEDPEVEEAYVTYWGLPAGLKGKIGRMRQRIGKASATHRDSLDTVDEPLVVQRYLGIEGLFRTGVELSGFTPLSLDEYTQELIVGIMEGGAGEDGDIFGETRRQPTFYGHLANFWELGEKSSVELGGTYMLGSSDDDSSREVNAFGIDLTFAHFFNPVNKLKLQSEAYFQDRDTENGERDEDESYERSSPWGFYSLADYRLARRWGTGVRYDYVQPVYSETGLRDAERAYSAYLTFFQSEFARWRLQYQYAALEDRTDDNRFFLQGTFAIGTHKHQIQ